MNFNRRSFAHLLNEVGNLKIEPPQIGFVPGQERRKIDEKAIEKIKSITRERVILMKNQSEKDDDYRLFQDKNHWLELIG